MCALGEKIKSRNNTNDMYEDRMTIFELIPFLLYKVSTKC